MHGSDAVNDIQIRHVTTVAKVTARALVQPSRLNAAIAVQLLAGALNWTSVAYTRPRHASLDRAHVQHEAWIAAEVRADAGSTPQLVFAFRRYD